MTETKRFYAFARAEPVEGGFAVMLDDRRLKTPKGSPFAAPTLALAGACADEWMAQGENIAPASMPITRLCFAASDLALLHGRALSEHILKYAETDLICHRADSPSALITRQAEVWDPIHKWAVDVLGVRLPVVTGVLAADAAPDIALLRMRIDTMDDYALTGLAQAASLSTSILIGFALLEGRLSGADAFAAATLDEHWNMEHWGLDSEALMRLERIRIEFEALGRFFAALRGG